MKRQPVFGFTFAALLILAGVAFLLISDAGDTSGRVVPSPTPGPAVNVGEGQ